MQSHCDGSWMRARNAWGELWRPTVPPDYRATAWPFLLLE